MEFSALLATNINLRHNAVEALGLVRDLTGKFPQGSPNVLSRLVMTAFGGWHRVEPRHLKNRHGRKDRHGAYISPSEWIGRHSDGSPILDSLHGTTLHRDVPDVAQSVDEALALADHLGFSAVDILQEASAKAMTMVEMVDIRKGRSRAFRAYLPLAIIEVVLQRGLGSDRGAEH